MPDEAAPERVGVRVARARKRRGLTQHGLAQKARYSRSHIAQVEAGLKMATPSFVAAIAAALGVDPAEIYGQPFRGRTPKADAVHAAIPDIRRTLVFVEVPPDPDGPPRPVAELRAELAALRELQAASRHRQVGTRLPSVLEELTWHAHGSGAPQVWADLFRAHETAADLCRKLGYHDLANGCLNAARESAARSEDPHLPLLVALRRSLLLAALAQWRPALALLDRAAGAVDDTRPDAAEIRGTAHLRAAVVAARAGDGATAWEHHGAAAELRRASDEPGDVHGVTTGFVPANVAVHGAAVAVELGDMDEALRRDAGLGARSLAGLVPERRAHHEIDMARAHVETGDHDRALARLVSAQDTAPQMTCYHPSARALVTHLVDVRRTLPEPLRRLHVLMSG
ncbi:helix-turn-helix domain-containing protein [Spirillospora sp. NPDC050679]